MYLRGEVILVDTAALGDSFSKKIFQDRFMRLLTLTVTTQEVEYKQDVRRTVYVQFMVLGANPSP